MREFPIFPFFCGKKKDLKIRFLEYGAVVNTRRSVLTYLYIIYYIKEGKDGNTLRG